MQIYREEARYLERTAPWIERVGLSHVKQHVVDDAENRKKLYARFLKSQEVYQFDPWQQRARGTDRHEFTPLHSVGVGA
jgi:nitrite reductase (NADH) large subunit